jgi:hypothetical protein
MTMTAYYGRGSRLRCRRVNVESSEDSDDRGSIDWDMTALPVPVLRGDAERLGQLVESWIKCGAVEIWHGVNLGRCQTS